jgi:hypothetical protein
MTVDLVISTIAAASFVLALLVVTWLTWLDGMRRPLPSWVRHSAWASAILMCCAGLLMIVQFIQAALA